MVADIFSGLENSGLDRILEDDIFAKQNITDISDKQREKKTLVNTVSEKDCLFDKTYVCPVCDSRFKSKAVRAGKIRSTGHDDDLRPRFTSVDVVKYEAVMCTECGYAAPMKTFSFMSPLMRKNIREKVTPHYIRRVFNGETYSYEEAIERYKIALVNCVVKMSKLSERAYVCLKLAWLYRGMAEELADNGGSPDKIMECRKNEGIFLEKAYNGFVKAISEEHFPICGMDEGTIMYLLAVLARKSKDYEMAKKLLGSILTSKTYSSNLKEQARLQKQILYDEIKEQANA